MEGLEPSELLSLDVAGKDSCDGHQEADCARAQVVAEHVGAEKVWGVLVAEARGAQVFRDPFSVTQSFYGLEFQLLHGAVWPRAGISPSWTRASLCVRVEEYDCLAGRMRNPRKIPGRCWEQSRFQVRVWPFLLMTHVPWHKSAFRPAARCLSKKVAFGPGGSGSPWRW